MVKTNLSAQDFAKYFKSNRLGNLHIPNGDSVNFRGYFQKGLDVNLGALFEVMSGWRINRYEVPLDDIFAVIAYGSAVKYPGYKMVPRIRKKYLDLFGPEIEVEKKELITPNDVDFYVLTGRDITRHKSIKPRMENYNCGSMGDITAVVEGGINLVNRGIGQLAEGIENGDTISISAMKEGIPVFYDDRFEEVRVKIGIERDTPRRIYWGEDYRANLIGEIK
ncbi:hypothetical protein HN832_01925 [archaeon]|jgi:hypothetical protein|nr:hypothetical protein [archaeon]MBT4373111.1 hypothetical protein [archaeon]MBT4531456.1 hypothetical protein [archaeon]MBT7001366.1 hypothetical protein [archaeon]MBT7282148.1 hypothetical protein [archaeon]